MTVQCSACGGIESHDKYCHFAAQKKVLDERDGVLGVGKSGLQTSSVRFNPLSGAELPQGTTFALDTWRWDADVWSFDPWTGEHRRIEDITSDPHGLRLRPPGEPLRGVPATAPLARFAETVAAPSGGGKLAGDHYYRVTVAAPISPELDPYTAECADIIEALNMTFNEGENFKAIWRLAAARQGRGKVGNKPQYDADKAAHYGARVAAQTRAQVRATGAGDV